MKKMIVVVCGTGLGSSFYVEINIREILLKYNLTEQYEVTHNALFDVNWLETDYIVIARDMAEAIAQEKPTVVLNSIIDAEELERKLIAVLDGE